jgi:hypothetical protein
VISLHRQTQNTAAIADRNLGRGGVNTGFSARHFWQIHVIRPPVGIANQKLPVKAWRQAQHAWGLLAAHWVAPVVNVSARQPDIRSKPGQSSVVLVRISSTGAGGNGKIPAPTSERRRGWARGLWQWIAIHCWPVGGRYRMPECTRSRNQARPALMLVGMTGVVDLRPEIWPCPPTAARMPARDELRR